MCSSSQFNRTGRNVISFAVLGILVFVQFSPVRLAASPYSKLDQEEKENSVRWPGMRSNALREMLGPIRGTIRGSENIQSEAESLAKGLKTYDNGEPGSEFGSEIKWPKLPNKEIEAKLSLNRPGLGMGRMDEQGRIRMGVSSEDCDDGKTNLTMDWDFSPVNYTCFHPETRFPMGSPKSPLLECTTLPEEYMPKHFCMEDPIQYEDAIPSYGDHRPLWPVFGEYFFVPRQRWLHNIEHGAVVMLYHPCAHPMEVNRLKKVVRECIGKHVITPSTLLSPDRLAKFCTLVRSGEGCSRNILYVQPPLLVMDIPFKLDNPAKFWIRNRLVLDFGRVPLALVAWGCRLLMSVVDEAVAISFIERRGLKGPEGSYTKEGQYTFGLIISANETKTARYDRITCPGSQAESM